MVPRYFKMKFPIYDGVGDPLGWLKRCEKFFDNQQTNEEDKVGLVAFHLLGKMQLWFDQMEEEEANLDWGHFKECCHVRTADLKPRQQVNLFPVELVEELRIDIEKQKLGNLGVAMNMARALEHKQNVSSKLLSRAILNWPTSENTGNSSIIPTTKSIAKGRGQTMELIGNSDKIGFSAPFIKRLTKAKMAKRMAKGPCYNCDEPYSMGHKCKILFWIKVSDVEGKQADDEVGDFG
ncbi:hypothetical protein GOBAR_DD29486 [Gossypium barbadense]|nr:hypothetical protein GOBAR_DD29486 [Gossypium barbadense]